MEERAGDACGVCESCLDVTTPGRMHPDLIEIDAASNGGKDEIRAIAERAQIMPLRATKKVYIIDEVHGLTGPGGQAFLKLLEEPPPHVVFALATTDPGKMLATNRGRCTEYELLAPTADEMAQNLLRVAAAEGWDLTTEAARAVVGASDPALGVRATLMTLEKFAADLDDGDQLDPARIAQSLQSLSAVQVDALTTAIDAGDTPLAFAALSETQRTATDAAIFDALITWSTNRLRNTTPATFTDDRARLGYFLDRPRTTGYIELAIAHALALVAPAARPASTPTAPTPPASTPTAPASPSDALAPTETTAAPQPDLEPSVDAPPTRRKKSTPTNPEGDCATPSPTSPVNRDPEVFIEAVATHHPRAAALLRACTITVVDDALRIEATPDIRRQLRAFGDVIPDTARSSVDASIRFAVPVP
jgi:DNA polymerase-3 subunit gamma/tau